MSTMGLKPKERVNNKPQQTTLPYVVIAEQSAAIRKTLVNLFSKNFQVSTFDSGDTVWREILQRPPDMVILDIDLPDFNGFGILDQIRGAREKNIQCIPVTLIGSNSKDELHAYQAGADAYLCRPLDQAQLYEFHNRVFEASNRSVPNRAQMPEFDKLTCLPNRRYFDERGCKEMATANRQNTSMALILVQLDDLEYIVMHHGAAIAKQVIKKLGGYIQADVRNEDTVARLDSRRFAVLAAATNEPGAKIIAERIRDHVRARVFHYDDKSFSFHVSLALTSQQPKKYKSFSHMHALAAERLAASVAAGGDSIVYDERSFALAKAEAKVKLNVDIEPAINAQVPEKKQKTLNTGTKKSLNPVVDQSANKQAETNTGSWMLKHGIQAALPAQKQQLLDELQPMLEAAKKSGDHDMQDLLKIVKHRLLTQANGSTGS